jgi:hypothetical protein
MSSKEDVEELADEASWRLVDFGHARARHAGAVLE